jgi:hypothetical protein
MWTWRRRKMDVMEFMAFLLAEGNRPLLGPRNPAKR